MQFDANPNLQDVSQQRGAMCCRVGDGDCGSTLAEGARAIKADCARCYPLNDLAQSMEAVGQSVGNSMGGSSGALYQIYFVAIAGQPLHAFAVRMKSILA